LRKVGFLLLERFGEDEEEVSEAKEEEEGEGESEAAFFSTFSFSSLIFEKKRSSFSSEIQRVS